MVTIQIPQWRLRDRRIFLPFVRQSTVVIVSATAHCYGTVFIWRMNLLLAQDSDAKKDSFAIFFSPLLVNLSFLTVGYDIGVSTEASALIQDDFELSRESKKCPS